VNARVNAGAHPSCHEPISHPTESPEFRSGLHHRDSPLVAAGEEIAWGMALPARFDWGQQEVRGREHRSGCSSRPYVTRRTAISHTLMSLDAEWRQLARSAAPAGR
jgi:hypothetical protein